MGHRGTAYRLVGAALLAAVAWASAALGKGLRLELADQGPARKSAGVSVIESSPSVVAGRESVK